MDRTRERCEVEYRWPGKDGKPERLTGVMRVRDVSGKGIWSFIDTTHYASNKRGPMCVRHSNIAGKPIYHGEEVCGGVTVAEADRAAPSMLRMLDSGSQQNPRAKGGKNGKTAKGAKPKNRKAAEGKDAESVGDRVIVADLQRLLVV